MRKGQGEMGGGREEQQEIVIDEGSGNKMGEGEARGKQEKRCEDVSTFQVGFQR